MSLDVRWNQLLGTNAGQFFQRVDETHPLDIYIGKEASGEPALLLVTDKKPPPSHEYQAIHFLSRTRSDHRWAVVFKLVKPELVKVFFLLCDDLVESCRKVIAGEDPVARLMSRFTRWQRLLDRGHDGLLPEPALRGLMGELLFMLHRILPLRDPLTAITAWTGPMGGDQDFSFSDHLHEVKTMRTGASTIQISSAEQMDVTSIPIDLAVVTLDDADASAQGTITPLTLVKSLTDMLEPFPDAADLFESRLIEAGFVRREEYGNRHYVHRGIREFSITPEFPAIVRSRLPTGIGKVSYEVELASCDAFELN